VIATLAESSQSLLKSMRSNEPRAWERLVRIYGPVIRKQVARRGVSADAVDDVIQEIFTSLYKSLNRFRKRVSTDRFLFWVRDITRKRIGDHFRRENGQKNGVGGLANIRRVMSCAAPGRSESVDRSWNQQDLLRDTIKRVTGFLDHRVRPETRDLFLRVTMDGASVRIVAEEFGKSETAVRTSVSRVLQRLRLHLGDLPESLRRSQERFGPVDDDGHEI